MASSASPRLPLSAAWRAALAELVPDGGQTLSFERFMEVALYHHELGYYRRALPRVGRTPGTDFYTATTVGPWFGEWVTAAAVRLLGGEAAARQHVFVEVGAEPGGGKDGGGVQGGGVNDGGVLAGVAHPFAAVRTLRLGDPLELSGPCVVFSNELFDAQPLRRWVRRGGAWRERGVSWASGTLEEVELPSDSGTGRSGSEGGAGAESALAGAWPEEAARWLPAEAAEGYQLDVSLAAMQLARRLAAQPWTGLWLAFDYGKSWAELSTATPQGTARAYHRHRQVTDLLHQPGEQDLTGHVCWDWLEAALRAEGCTDVAVVSQEAFFVRHAGECLARVLAEEAGRLSARKQAVLQLLHPAHLGQKFQVLSARKG